MDQKQLISQDRKIIEIQGYGAKISYDKEIKLFRGEFLNLNGYADFYSNNINDLMKEGEISLKVFFELLHEKWYNILVKIYEIFTKIFITNIKRNIEYGK